MSLQDGLELPKRKKAAVKAKAKPVADRHRPEPTFTGFTRDEVVGYVMSLDDRKLSEMQALIALEVTGRHQLIREQLEAQAAAIGAKVTFPGKGKGQAAPIKYRDEHGNTWAGRGLQPNWLKERIGSGDSLEDFAV